MRLLLRSQYVAMAIIALSGGMLWVASVLIDVGGGMTASTKGSPPDVALTVLAMAQGLIYAGRWFNDAGRVLLVIGGVAVVVWGVLLWRLFRSSEPAMGGVRLQGQLDDTLATLGELQTTLETGRTALADLEERRIREEALITVTRDQVKALRADLSEVLLASSRRPNMIGLVSLLLGVVGIAISLWLAR